MVVRCVLLACLTFALFGVPTAATRTAAQSGDGLIAYQRDPKGGISVIPAEGAKSRRISARHGAPWWHYEGPPPVWSPDGKWLAIVDSRRVPEGHVCLDDDDYYCPSEIYLIRPDGTGERRVTPTAEHTTAPVWSPDSQKLAYSSAGVVHVVNVDGSGFRRLTTKASGYIVPSSWSPDGQTVACTQSRSGYDIYLIGLDGRKRRLTGDRRSSEPRWSPDGRLIAFLHDDTRGGETRAIYLMGADGTRRRPLVRSGDSWGITWSPNGSKLAYVNEVVLDERDVYTVERTSALVRRLTPKDPSLSWTDPSWSPDGTKLVVTLNSDRVKEEIWILGATRSRKTRLVVGGDSAAWQPRPG